VSSLFRALKIIRFSTSEFFQDIKTKSNWKNGNGGGGGQKKKMTSSFQKQNIKKI